MIEPPASLQAYTEAELKAELIRRTEGKIDTALKDIEDLNPTNKLMIELIKKAGFSELIRYEFL